MSDHPKSIHSNCRVFVTFVNASQRSVDLYWLGWQGELVRYKDNMAPGERYRINTYATHPWVARDCVTGQRMRVCGQPVYVPKEPLDDEDPNVRHDILIQIPVYRLEDICIGYIRKNFTRDTVANLEINSYLKKKVCNIPKLETKNYQSSR